MVIDQEFAKNDTTGHTAVILCSGQVIKLVMSGLVFQKLSGLKTFRAAHFV